MGLVHQYIATGRYDLAEALSGYERGTLWNLACVAGNVESSRRHEDLTWAHHAEVVGLRPEDQEHFLARASEENWTRVQLRSAVKRMKEQRDEAVEEARTAAAGNLDAKNDEAAVSEEHVPRQDLAEPEARSDVSGAHAGELEGVPTTSKPKRRASADDVETLAADIPKLRERLEAIAQRLHRRTPARSWKGWKAWSEIDDALRQLEELRAKTFDAVVPQQNGKDEVSSPS